MRSDPEQLALTQDDHFTGYMDKRQPNFLKTWQKRYWVLENRMLKYYRQDQDYLNQLPPKGVINFEQVSVDYEFIDKEQKINLRIKGCDRVFLLRVQNNQHYNQWKTKITHSIDKSIGKT